MERRFEELKIKNEKLKIKNGSCALRADLKRLRRKEKQEADRRQKTTYVWFKMGWA